MHPDALAQLRKLDREDLAVMLRVLHGAKKALKARDECGDPVIAGSRGAIRGLQWDVLDLREVLREPQALEQHQAGDGRLRGLHDGWR